MNRGDPTLVVPRVQPTLNLTHLTKEKRMTPEELQHDHHANPQNANVKPAYKTTEFWLSTVAVVVGILLASGFFKPEDPTDARIIQVLGLVASILSSLGYTAARTSAKNRATEAAAAVAIAKVTPAGIGAINLLKSAGVSDPTPPASS